MEVTKGADASEKMAMSSGFGAFTHRVRQAPQRPALEAAATVVAAWILWTALSAVIDEKMPPPATPGDENEIPGSASRLDT